MTAPQQPHDPDVPLLSEEAEREVTALLAGLEDRGPVTTPPEVAARLDDVLAGLVAERTGTASPTGSRVVALERRPRPRRWPRGLLAAAAVLVVGYGTVQVVSDGSIGVSSSDSAGSSGGSSAGRSAGSSAGQDEGDSDSLGNTGSDSGGGLAGGRTMSVVPTVRSDHLAADVRRVVRLFGARPVTRTPSPGGSSSTSPPTEASSGTPEELPACPVPRLTEDQRLYEVRFHGKPAGLVVGAPEQGSVDVTVYACRDGGVRLTRTVPAP